MDPKQGQTPPEGIPQLSTGSQPGDYSAPGMHDQGASSQAPPSQPVQGAPGEGGPAPVPPAPAAGAPTPPTPPPAAVPTAAPVYGGMPPVPPQPATGGKKSGRASIWLTAIVSGVIGALLVLAVMPAIFGVNPYDLVRGKVKKVDTVVITPPRTGPRGVSPSQGATDVTAIARKVTPSVVNIDVRTAPQRIPFMTLQPSEGTGSGVIYKADGYIITNNHVVTDAQDIMVTLASGKELKATKVGADPENDIAVVKVDQKDLPTIEIGDSDKLEVGQLVVAVGSPLGFEQTVTAGIISALHRVVGAQSPTGQAEILIDLIQTDAPINPGNSGGALCDGSAKLIGINTLIATQSGGSEGLGFAIPISTAKQVADDLIAGRPVSHPYLGVLGQTISADIATSYNLPVDSGAYVTRVAPQSPADKAQIKANDIIVDIDGKPIKSMDDVIASVRSHKVGDKLTVTFYSGGSKKSAEVTLEERPSNVQ